MTAEHERIDNFHDVRASFGVCLADVLEDLDLHERLRIVLCFVLDHLQRNSLLELVVDGFEDLAKRTLAQEVLHLITVANMVVIEYLHLALLIVEVVMVLWWLLSTLA